MSETTTQPSSIAQGKSQIVEIPLSGLSCMGCARKVSTAVSAIEGVTDASADKGSLSVTGNVSLNEVFDAVENLGYQAGNSASLTLSGLRCGKCIAKLKAAFDQNPLIASHGVSKTRADVRGLLAKDDIISIVEAAGFQVVDDAALTEQKEDVSPVAKPEITASDKPSASQQTDTISQLILSGMTCASCVSSVENALTAVDGVTSVNVNLAERTAQVKGQAVSADSLINAVIDTGYGAELIEDDTTRREKQNQQQVEIYQRHLKHALIALGVGTPLMLWGIFGGSMTVNSTASQINWGIISLICFALLATTGKAYFKGAFNAIRHRRANMDSLIALGTSAAWLYSTVVVLAPTFFPESARHVYFEATAMILGLITLGHAIEAKARASASSALDKLLDLQPVTTTLVTDSGERELSLKEVTAGMTLRIYPGERIPVDGKISEGESYVDESMLTGEPIAVRKCSGDDVSAGTLNQKGSLLMVAQGVGENTMLARIIHLVREAQNSKPALAKMADSISAVFVPIVIAISVFTALVWYAIGPEPSISYMLITATTVLIIACPCALGLATPMSVITGVGRAAELGVLIKDAEAIQHAAKVDTVVFDKTGTLTEGKPSITSIYPLDIEETELLTFAASIEKGSEHPLATAVISYSEDKGIQPVAVENFTAVPGQGISASINSKRFFVGNKALLTANNIDCQHAESLVAQMTEKGETPVYVADSKRIIGLLGISDPVRSDSASAVSRLIASGIHVVMLTGDHPSTANAIASQLGIGHVIAGVMPDGKEEEIRKLQHQGKTVAMVGDGINDAPALARANVGIAMGGGSDVAIESGQMTLIRHSAHSVVDALAVSKATIANMKQNLWGAFIYNAFGIPIAAGVLFPLTGALLSPVVAGAAMALSSITVVSNANRLRWFTPKQG